ncbi:MAG: ribonuclease P protein component [Pseudobutyrivibrio sp.]|nr:ribonuclease P protein component [Pseudobutyrivibrio sp.]
MRFSESLKKNSDFTTVYRRGVSKANRHLVMYIYHNNTDQNRIGISVSKKVGNSVVRHHVTRLIRESYRLSEEMFNSGLDIVVVARESTASASFEEINKSLLHLANLLKVTRK